MNRFPKTLVLFFCFLLIVSLSGCALLSLPGTIIGGTFQLLGELLRVVSKMPKPPPGVF